jgi:hypothetical protein
MKTWTISAIILMALLIGRPANAQNEAWSIGSFACNIWTVGGTVDDATHYVDYSPAYGWYTTTTNDGTSFLLCPVWIPHREYIDTLKFRATDPLSGDTCGVAVYLYRQHSIYGTTTPGTEDFTLLTSTDCKTTSTSSTPFVKSCGFTRHQVCNYNDGTAPCNVDTNVYMYYALIGITANETYIPKVYNIWVGDPPVSSSESYENYSEPVDCGWAMEKYNEGLEITEDEKGCFIMYEMSMP